MINIFFVIVAAVLIYEIASGYKKGMVREIVSFVSLIILCIVALLLGIGIHSYFEGEYVGVAIAFFLLVIIGILHHLFGVVFFSAKLVSKLPVVHWLDKLLGTVAGVLETVVILWAVYTMIIFMDTGVIGQQILLCTEENPVLTWFYQRNYLAFLVQQLGTSLGLNIPDILQSIF